MRTDLVRVKKSTVPSYVSSQTGTITAITLQSSPDNVNAIDAAVVEEARIAAEQEQKQLRLRQFQHDVRARVVSAKKQSSTVLIQPRGHEIPSMSRCRVVPTISSGILNPPLDVEGNYSPKADSSLLCHDRETIDSSRPSAVSARSRLIAKRIDQHSMMSQTRPNTVSTFPRTVVDCEDSPLDCRVPWTDSNLKPDETDTENNFTPRAVLLPREEYAIQQKVKGEWISHQASVRKEFMDKDRERVRQATEIRRARQNATKLKRDNEAKRKECEEKTDSSLEFALHSIEVENALPSAEHSGAFTTAIPMLPHQFPSPPNSARTAETYTVYPVTTGRVAKSREDVPVSSKSRQIESARFQSALVATARDSALSKGVEIPPLCGCNDDFWTADPLLTCVNNCTFYMNRQAYNRAATALLRSFDVHVQLST